MYKHNKSLAKLMAFFLAGCLTIFSITNSNAIETQGKIIDPKVKEVSDLLDSWSGQPEILEEANKKLSEILNKYPKNYYALLQLARYQLKNGYINTTSGRYKSYNFEVGNYDPGTLDTAKTTVLKAISINPSVADGYVLLASIQMDKSQLDDAEKSLNQAEAIGTKDPWLQLTWAELNQARGEYSAAEIRYKRVLNSDTKDNKAKSASLIYLINSSKRVGSSDQAVRLYKKYLELNPSNAWVRGEFAGYLNSTLGRNDEAVFQAQKALKIMDYGVGKRILAMALYGKWADLIKQGNDAMAKKYFDDASKIRPDLNLVMVYGASMPAGEALAKALIKKKGISIDAVGDENRSTALLVATNQNNIKAVKFLLKLGANPNVSDASGWTPLLSAADEGNSEIVELLLANKADINQTLNGMDAATFALNKGNKKLYETLKNKN